MTLTQLLQGLRRLGLKAEESDASNPSFLTGVWMDRGVLYAHASAPHGNVLHEAGHLALVPSRFREMISPGDIEEGPLAMAIQEYLDSEECRTHPDPDHPLLRAILQMGDCEATAWSYAAAVELGVPIEDLYYFPGLPKKKQPFDGEGSEIFAMIRVGRYLGIHGLQAAGMCSVRTWPRMNRWLAV